MRGQCLCGDVAFELDATRLALYRCHCSLCRRQSGGASNWAAIAHERQLRWSTGQASIRSWNKESGFRSDFCSRCGSPVPNLLRDLAHYWVPAGLLDDVGESKITADFHLDSKASWDDMATARHAYGDLPSLDVILALLHPGEPAE